MLHVTAPTRPVLRYYGGKFRMAPWIVSMFPVHHIYVELFGGAASVLLQKPRSAAEVYNDLDGELVNLFRVLRDARQASELRRLLELTPYAREEWVDSYLESDDPVERARRSIVRSFMGFGSSAFLATSRGPRRTGFRRKLHSAEGVLPSVDWAGYPGQVPLFCERLRGVLIECRDYESVLAYYDRPDALIYADPPYVQATRSSCEHRYRHDMSDADHRRLAALLSQITGMAVVSGYAHALYDHDLYVGWQRHERQAWADGTRPRTEILWLSPRAAAALERTRDQYELALPVA
jgi:DNA adenine methylase